MTELYHQGEIAVQEMTGERDKALLNGRVIAPVIPAPARPFVGQQSCIAIGWRDASGDPWAALLVGHPGFATSDDLGTTVTIQTHHDGIRTGDAVGLLIIDLATRRRLRVNGLVDHTSSTAFRVEVEQAFPNCPKYIQKRERLAGDPEVAMSAVTTGPGIPPDLQAWLARTDTAFITSVGPDGRLDCSHRGGRPGFMRLDGDTVHVPDYPGNSMYCTLGNMTVEPAAGLVLVDFEAQQQLRLTGLTRVDVGPARRGWSIRPRAWAVSPLATATPWRLIEESPFNPEVTP